MRPCSSRLTSVLHVSYAWKWSQISRSDFVVLRLAISSRRGTPPVSKRVMPSRAKWPVSRLNSSDRLVPHCRRLFLEMSCLS